MGWMYTLYERRKIHIKFSGEPLVKWPVGRRRRCEYNIKPRPR